MKQNSRIQDKRINLTALKYIVSIYDYRNFVKAAEACHVSQPALSTAVRNLEDELGIAIFDRNTYPVRPTAIGEKIVILARKTLQDAAQIEEIVNTEKGEESGNIEMGIIPTIAPYILPLLFKKMQSDHPAIHLRAIEMRTKFIIEKLLASEIDMAILATPLNTPGLLEIPVYYEKFVAYISPSEKDMYGLENIPAAMLPSERLWVLEEGHCLRSQVFNFCNSIKRSGSAYEAGSIDTLVKVVDANGGYTVIPELHTGYLTEAQKQNLRPIKGETSADSIHCNSCIPVREVSLVIREDYVRERMLNIVADTIKTFIPDNMLDARLKRFAIRL